MDIAIPERDGDGYLLDMNDWTPEIGKAMADTDGFEMSDLRWDQVMKARDYYDEHATVPPIRKFAKYVGQDKKVLFKEWMTGPMKP